MYLGGVEKNSQTSVTRFATATTRAQNPAPVLIVRTTRRCYNNSKVLVFTAPSLPCRTHIYYQIPGTSYWYVRRENPRNSRQTVMQKSRPEKQRENAAELLSNIIIITCFKIDEHGQAYCSYCLLYLSQRRLCYCASCLPCGTASRTLHDLYCIFYSNSI